MINYTSKKWKLFVSRPTSILKRDFMKWTYLDIDKINGVKLSKLLAIGDDGEMDVFVDKKEDEANFRQAVKHYRNKEMEKVFARYEKLIKNYKLRGRDLAEKSLNAIKDVGPILIYSYYAERLADFKKNKRLSKLIERNGDLRDKGAKIIYPLYNRAFSFLGKKYKKKPINRYTVEELPGTVGGKEINARKKFYVFLGTKKGTKIFTGETAASFLKRQGFAELRNNKSGDVKGLAACLGKIRGKVKIVRSLSDVKKSAGKIIVARETIIEYTPYIKKALGLVTDFGGINSHAAVISREFKKPCIVGTKTATQVLKDGDLIEMNADEGIVTKL
ncbi:MAG: PEP-utilizing enzyme [Patescibacteria group bacterium]|nr:PEP-utilizing enzyme [Patescibacteria group bacterium]MDD5554595.1 PEP-utilizing enzyme [Patescibacteria group bacterium]